MDFECNKCEVKSHVNFVSKAAEGKNRGEKRKVVNAGCALSESNVAFIIIGAN